MPQQKTAIAHVINLDTVGGVERLYCQFINADIRRAEHHTVSCRNSIAPVLRQDLEKGSKSIHFTKKFYAVKIPKWPSVLRKQRLQSIFRDISPDLVIVWNKPEGFDLSLLAPGIKVLYYEHGAAWNNHSRKKVRCFLDKVSGIICNSQASQKILEFKYRPGPEANYHICLNPIRPDCLPPAFKAKKFPAGRAFHLGVAARLLPFKGICLAVHAVKILKTSNIHCRLFIAGIGPEKKNLQSLAGRLGLENEITFCNLVEDMSQFYQNIDCFLCPSVREPFGLVAAEAMAHGCPAIVAAVDGLPEVISHNKNGFCIEPDVPLERYCQTEGTRGQWPEYVYDARAGKAVPPKSIDPANLAGKIQALYSRPELYESMSLAAIQSARQRFDFTNYIKLFYAVLLEVERNVL
ncbi:MAG: glycosyltransferase family 4 protein [Gammaproteobacteria bacterium]|nr:glycosyltransferase family 4 protein [Gammaproteobacteria bacterium]